MRTKAIAPASDIRLAMAGDAEAYARVVEWSASTVCSISLAIVRDVHASEDVAQDVFLTIWKELHRLRNPASFVPWLRQITRNHAYDWLRVRRHEAYSDEAIAAACDPRPSVSDTLIANEEREELGRVLDELPDETREVVVLYYREGSSARHAAELLGINEEAVRQRLSRARGRIREAMLARFGRTLVRTAPGAAFTAAVAGALIAAAPGAAAVQLSVAGTATAKLPGFALAAKAMGAGLLTGVAGVLMSSHHLGPPFDEREARELRVFHGSVLAALLAMTAAMSLITQLPAPRWPTLALHLLWVGGVGAFYLIRLPRILARRHAWERETDPSATERHRTIWRDGEMGRALSAGVTGGVLMLLVAKLFA